MTEHYEFEHRMHDYLDGLLSEAEARAFEAHLDKQGELREEADAMRAVLEKARGLHEWIEPERDLWPAIRDRIEGRVVPFRGRNARRLGVVLGYIAAAAAAVLLITGWVLMSRPAVSPKEAPTAEATDLQKAEQEYRAAKEALLAAFEERRDALSQETLDSVMENLAIIDDAISDIRLALADGPEDPYLERLLIATYKNELNLLQRVVQLARQG
jgi:anti-sigma-K factor RskA